MAPTSFVIREINSPVNDNDKKSVSLDAPRRYVGWARNAAAIQMLNLCYNLKRYETILRLKLHPRAAA